MSALAPARRFVGPVAPRLIRYRRPAFVYLPCRNITSDEKPLPKKDTAGKGPTEDVLPSVSEEASQTCKVTGEGGPELEQGTPVQEILRRDKEAAKHAPEVLKNDTSKNAGGARSFSTLTRRLQELQVEEPSALASATTQALAAGLKFAAPSALGRNEHLRRREPEVIQRATRLLMREGKLARAQTTMARILNLLRTSAPPAVNPARPLHPDAPPASQLPLNPVEYFACALDSIAPLVRLQSMKGFAGGGASLQVPKPLTLWQRRRQALVWVLDSASKKRSRGSGRAMFAQKVADEIIGIVEGKSALWERRQALHRLSTAARANLTKVNMFQRYGRR